MRYLVFRPDPDGTLPLTQRQGSTAPSIRTYLVYQTSASWNRLTN
jgi:hypothetical protein